MRFSSQKRYMLYDAVKVMLIDNFAFNWRTIRYTPIFLSLFLSNPVVQKKL